MVEPVERGDAAKPVANEADSLLVCQGMPPASVPAMAHDSNVCDETTYSLYRNRSFPPAPLPQSAYAARICSLPPERPNRRCKPMSSIDGARDMPAQIYNGSPAGNEGGSGYIEFFQEMPSCEALYNRADFLFSFMRAAGVPHDRCLFDLNDNILWLIDEHFEEFLSLFDFLKPLDVWNLISSGKLRNYTDLTTIIENRSTVEKLAADADMSPLPKLERNRLFRDYFPPSFFFADKANAGRLLRLYKTGKSNGKRVYRREDFEKIIESDPEGFKRVFCEHNKFIVEQLGEGCLVEAINYFVEAVADGIKFEDYLAAVKLVLKIGGGTIISFHFAMEIARSKAKFALVSELHSACPKDLPNSSDELDILRQLLYYASPSLIENHGDILVKVFRRMHPRSLMRAASFYVQLAKIPITPSVDLFIEHVRDYTDEKLLLLLDYLDRIGFPEEKISALAEGGISALTPKDLSFNYRAGEDMSDFNPKYMDLYGLLFRRLREAGMTVLEKSFLSYIRFDRIVKMIRAGRIAEVLSIGAAAETIHPTIKHAIYKRVAGGLEAGMLAGIFKRWLNPKTRMLDVTQNNIGEVNAILNYLIFILNDYHTCFNPITGDRADCELIEYRIENDLKMIFPGEDVPDSFEAGMVWFANHLDVEEINFAALKGLDGLEEFIALQENMIRLRNNAASRYLSNRFADIDLQKMFEHGGGGSGTLVTDLDAIEALRTKINLKGRVLGDEFIDYLGTSYLEGHPACASNLAALVAFAHAWGISTHETIHKDVLGLYNQFSNFAYSMIADFIKHGAGDGRDGVKWKRFAAQLKKNALDLEALTDELESNGFPIRSPSDAAKVLGRIFTNPVYTVNRTAQKSFGGASQKYDLSAVTFSQEPLASRNGVKVTGIMLHGKEAAKSFKFDREKVGVKILAEKSGVVDTNSAKARLGNKYVFSAPLSMTTGDHKMTELAFRDGEQINWLISPKGKDGLLIVGPDLNPKVLDKRSIKVSDLLAPEDLAKAEIRSICKRWQNLNGRNAVSCDGILNETLRPFHRIKDRRIFIEILKAKHSSLLCGMLVINGNEVFAPADGQASRRFFVEYDDGSFGIMNSTQDMSTGDLVALSQSVNARRAIYMDTGMYDMADYCEANGTCHLLGHPDTNESTNRVVVFEK